MKHRFMKETRIMGGMWREVGHLMVSGRSKSSMLTAVSELWKKTGQIYYEVRHAYLNTADVNSPGTISLIRQGNPAGCTS